MKSAFLIVAHGNFDMLKCLIKSLDYADNAMFIHIDKKCGDIDYTQFESIAKHSHVECLQDRMSVTWGGVSQIECTLKILKCAVPHKYDYYHLISGVDYPLMTNEDLSLFLDSNKGCEFVGFVNERKDLKKKLGYYHFFIDSRNRLMKRAGSILIKIQKIMGIRQYKDIDYFAKGCNWWSISHGLASALVEHEKEIIRKYRFSLCCDEFFVQTFIKHHPIWIDKLYCNKDEYQGCMRMIDWTRGNPYVFTLDDMDEVAGCKRLFIRKVKDVSVMNEIEKYRKKND